MACIMVAIFAMCIEFIRGFYIISLVYILEQSNGVLHDYLVDGIEPLKIEMIMVTGICVLLLQTVIKRVLRRMNYV